MVKDADSSDTIPGLSADQLYALERMRVRYGLWKVVFGTAVVGVVTAALPFIIEVSRLTFDVETSRRDFVADYVEALEKEPRARIALAEYFAFVLPDDGQRRLWQSYREHLLGLEAQRTATAAELDRRLAARSPDDPEEIRRLRDELQQLQRRLEVPAPTPRACSPEISFDRIAGEYRELLDSMEVAPDAVASADRVAEALIAARPRYAAVGAAAKVPWQLVALLHHLEAAQNFGAHLHNGDPLTARTVHVPKGRPPVGDPPFTWDESAADALSMIFPNGVDDEPAAILYALERWNGFGYRRRTICTPYLWGRTNHHVRGSFLADGSFDPRAPAGRVGAAPILVRLPSDGA